MYGAARIHDDLGGALVERRREGSQPGMDGIVSVDRLAQSDLLETRAASTHVPGLDPTTNVLIPSDNQRANDTPDVPP